MFKLTKEEARELFNLFLDAASHEGYCVCCGTATFEPHLSSCIIDKYLDRFKEFIDSETK